MTKCKFLLLLAVSALTFSGCKTQQGVQSTQPESSSVGRTKNSDGTFRTLSMDKTTFTLYNADGNRTSLNGSIRICRDSLIICSIRPFMGINMEFARIGINQQGIIVIDRINKQYFRISFADAQQKFGMEMNYNSFESIFTDRVFVYNSPYIPLTTDFKIANVADQQMLSRSDSKVNQEFYMDAAKTLIGGMIAAGANYSMRWSYSEFQPVNNVNFPFRLTLKIAGPDFHRQVLVQYKQVELDRDTSFDFKIPSSYTEVSLDTILKSF